MADSGKAVDFKLFKRLLGYTNSYRFTYYFVAFAAACELETRKQPCKRELYMIPVLHSDQSCGGNN